MASDEADFVQVAEPLASPDAGPPVSMALVASISAPVAQQGPENTTVRLAADKRDPEAAAMVTVEDHASLFDDILHPEAMEALSTLQQLDFEEAELMSQMRRLLTEKKAKSEQAGTR